CKDALRAGHNQSGIYSINNPRNNKTLKVYCDQTTDDGGWLVFQRRTDGSENFYRTWAEYQETFGNLSNEFWLGLDNIHDLTATKAYELRIELEDCENVTKFANAKYVNHFFSSFFVGSVAENYFLKVSGYSGNAGDSLSYQSGSHFTTKDVDNDLNVGNCAVLAHGAWWYINCYHSNLNGAYLKCQTTTYHASSWFTFHGTQYSLKFIEMKFRPI
uniref:Fibrinogen C-terminal domain-containing protein n=1 Tax=Ciona savignyi TaxID=51511 RepID=H2Z0U8_CIOSA